MRLEPAGRLLAAAESCRRPFFMKPSYFRSSRCCCICASVSSATPTTISSDVPPKRNGTLIASRDHDRQQRDEREEDRAREGDARLTTWSMYSAVFAPGFTPGMNPPCFFRFSARSIGLKMIDV